jgi:hypothetical protein
MPTIDSRLERLEREIRFRIWIRFQRMLERLTVDELEAGAFTGQWPDRPEPAPEMCSLDKMDRASLIKLWKEDQQKLEGRNRSAAIMSNNRPLQELARLEIRRRELLRDLVAVESERQQLLLGVRFQGLTIPGSSILRDAEPELLQRLDPT